MLGYLASVDPQIMADIEMYLDSEGGRTKTGLLRSVAEEFSLEQENADAIIAGVLLAHAIGERQRCDEVLPEGRSTAWLGPSNTLI